MRKTLLAIAVAMLPVSATPAEQPGALKLDQPATSGKLLPLKGAAAANGCAGYGPGFVKVDGTGTCVKIGGAISVETGTSVGPR
jgi:hypothetical protein